MNHFEKLVNHANKQQGEFNIKINESLNNIKNDIYTVEDLKNEIAPILKNINERLTILENEYKVVNNI